MQKKHLLPLFSVIFISHAIRDLMQYKGIDNIFTSFNHMAIPKSWELVSMILFIILSAIYFMFYLRISRV